MASYPIQAFWWCTTAKKNAHAHRYYIASNFLEIQDVY